MAVTITTLRPLADQDPSMVGPFQTVARLGMGGMGVVYLATDPRGQQVALKVVRSELADQPSFRTRFAREVAAARAVRGPYTAAVVGADTESSPQWIASQYVPGPTVAEHVEASGPLPADQVRLLGLGLAEAIQDIHAAGLIHRDLKPSNVILSAEGPKVIDFGIAHAADATSLTQTGAYVGSLAWMSPEQVTGSELTPAADLFAWGLVVAYAALGRHPFGEGRPEAVAFRMINQGPDLTGLPLNLRRAILAVLVTEPEMRATPAQVRSLLMADQREADEATRVIAQSWDATIVGAPAPVDVTALLAPHRTTSIQTAPEPRGNGRTPAVLAAAGLLLAAAASAGGAALHRAGTESTGGPGRGDHSVGESAVSVDEESTASTPQAAALDLQEANPNEVFSKVMGEKDAPWMISINGPDVTKWDWNGESGSWGSTTITGGSLASVLSHRPDGAVYTSIEQVDLTSDGLDDFILTAQNKEAGSEAGSVIVNVANEPVWAEFKALDGKIYGAGTWMEAQGSRLVSDHGAHGWAAPGGHLVTIWEYRGVEEGGYPRFEERPESS